MAQAAIFAVLALFFVTVAYAVPTRLEHEEVTPDDIINALDMGIITNFHTIITLESLLTNLSRYIQISDDLISIDLSVNNTLPIELTIQSISVAAGLNGTEYLTFNQTFEGPGLVLPELGITHTGRIGNVLFVQGTIATLDIAPAGVLDVLDMNVSVSAASQENGQPGISLEVDGLKQSAVPTIYDLSLGG